MIKPPRILFFVNGCVPSDEQMLEAQGYGTRVSFRNATMVPAPIYKEVKNAEGEKTKVLKNPNFLEECDGVAGDVPALYESYPRAEVVLDEYEKARVAALAEAKEKAKKKEAELKKKAKEEAEAKAKAEVEAKAEEEQLAKVKAENEKAMKSAQEKLAKEAKPQPGEWKSNK